MWPPAFFLLAFQKFNSGAQVPPVKKVGQAHTRLISIAPAVAIATGIGRVASLIKSARNGGFCEITKRGAIVLATVIHGKRRAGQAGECYG